MMIVGVSPTLRRTQTAWSISPHIEFWNAAVASTPSGSKWLVDLYVFASEIHTWSDQKHQFLNQFFFSILLPLSRYDSHRRASVVAATCLDFSKWAKCRCTAGPRKHVRPLLVVKRHYMMRKQPSHCDLKKSALQSGRYRQKLDLFRLGEISTEYQRRHSGSPIGRSIWFMLLLVLPSFFQNDFLFLRPDLKHGTLGLGTSCVCEASASLICVAEGSCTWMPRVSWQRCL